MDGPPRSSPFPCPLLPGQTLNGKCGHADPDVSVSSLRDKSATCQPLARLGRHIRRQAACDAQPGDAAAWVGGWASTQPEQLVLCSARTYSRDSFNKETAVLNYVQQRKGFDPNGDGRCNRLEWQDASIRRMPCWVANYCTWGDITPLVRRLLSLAVEYLRCVELG